jgi:hypothetical protein
LQDAYQKHSRKKDEKTVDMLFVICDSYTHTETTVKQNKIMRTKTLALSAVLGMLGSASLVAQNNVYSINAVGYINVTMPPGYSIVTCPLIAARLPGRGQQP